MLRFAFRLESNIYILLASLTALLVTSHIYSTIIEHRTSSSCSSWNLERKRGKRKKKRSYSTTFNKRLSELRRERTSEMKTQRAICWLVKREDARDAKNWRWRIERKRNKKKKKTSLLNQFRAMIRLRFWSQASNCLIFSSNFIFSYKIWRFKISLRFSSAQLQFIFKVMLHTHT